MRRQHARKWSIVALALVLALVPVSGIVSAAVNPTISSASYDVSTGKLTLTGTGMVTLPKTGDDINPTKIILSDGVSNQITLGSSTKKVDITNDTTAEVILGANDRKIVESWMKVNAAAGVTPFRVAVLAGWNGPASQGDLTGLDAEEGKPMAVTGFAVATLQSAIYDVSAGTLTLTATGGDLIDVAGNTANDIDPTKIILSDGVSNQTVLGSATKKVEITNGTTAVITLSTADRKLVDGWVKSNGADYKISVLPGWNGPTSQGDLEPKTLTATGWSGPIATMISEDDVIVSKAVSAKSSKTGFIYLVTSSAAASDKAALDALVTAKNAAKGTVSKVDTAVAITTTGLAPGVYKVIAVDAYGSLSAKSAGSVTLVNLPTLTATAAVGSVASSTKVTVTDTLGTGNKLVVLISDEVIAQPAKVGASVPSGTQAYTSGADLPGVNDITDKYVGVYEVTKSNTVVKFAMLTLTTAQVKPAVSKEALTAAIDAEVGADHEDLAYVLEEADYTGDSWTAYTVAIAAAIAAEKNETDDTAIGNATDAIVEAKDDLEFAGQDALDTAKVIAPLVESDYTVGSWLVLQTKLALPETTNAEVITKTTAITSAKAALELAGKPTLTGAITAAVGTDHAHPAYVLTATDYTVDSWTAYTTAVGAAITAEGNAATTEEDMTSLIGAIGAAKTGLVNKVALTAAITAEVGADRADRVYVLTEADYTEASWDAYVAAIDAAIIAETSAADAQAITAKVTALGTAKTALVLTKAASKAALTAAITAAVGPDRGTPDYAFALTQGDYTGPSWTAFQAAIVAAITVEGNANATEEEIVNAKTAIADSLVFTNQAALDAAMNISALTETDYTVDSWDDLETALALPETTKALVDTKITEITDAKTALVFAGLADLTAAKNITALTESDYTVASWDDLETALGLPETTQALIATKITEITDAKAALVLQYEADLSAAEADAATLTTALKAALELTVTTKQDAIDKTAAINQAIADLIALTVAP